ATDEYLIGDIVVFNYQREGRLAHRLVKTDNGVYLCKGDNSYRIEAIRKSDILGKVTFCIRNGKKLNIKYNSNKTKLLCFLSIKINKLFIKLSLEDLHKSFIYKIYKQLFLNIFLSSTKYKNYQYMYNNKNIIHFKIK
ncbi:MAG: hypothetical protein K0S55_1591, partial [Clostridia bacterium]|nr:hypothetical protein [Clostridia bacterium]